MSKKNLLIECVPGSGKSTLLAGCIDALGLRPFCAGYTTARVFGTDGSHRGFVHYPAANEWLGQVTTDEPLPLFVEPPGNGEAPVFHEGIFLETVPRLLVPFESAKLILIDEMGGGELGLPEIRKAYLEALKGELPVLGVLKDSTHAKKFSPEANLEFRREITEKTDTQILPMDPENREQTEKVLKRWLAEQTGSWQREETV